MNCQCEFVSSSWFGHEQLYTCVISDQQINEDGETNYTGRNKQGKNRMDVEAVELKDCKITKVPQNLTEIFPNLRFLGINSSSLRTLNKDDLAEYKNLEYLVFDGNQIESLPHDLFEGFEKLKAISFENNNLTFIEPNILDGLSSLKYVDFEGNPNYNMCFSDNPNESNATLDEINNELYEKFYQRFGFVRELKDSTAILQSKVTELEKTKSLENVNKFMENVLKTFKQNIPLAPRGDLSADLKNLTKDETFKDFKIVIDDREFPVHKFLLAARSPTLAEMLRNNPEAENLKLVDISVEIFELILKFLYTDELPNEDGTNYMHLFASAGRLRIKELKNFAAGKLIDIINEENALEILNSSNKYGHDELRQKAFDQIKKNHPEIEIKDEWIEDDEKLSKFIGALKMREEMLRKADEEFKKMMM